jgi:hypothetical protein
MARKAEESCRLFYNRRVSRFGRKLTRSCADRLQLTIVEEISMKKLFSVVIMALFAANMAFAADASCEAKAAEKKLAGAAKTNFMTKCEKDAAAAGTPSCAVKAADKKLAGAAKNAFMTKCEKDAAAAAAPSCETQAAEKKLAGAAKNSFVKKCTEGGAGK